MSRFYDALRQASQSLQGENAGAEWELSEPFAGLADTDESSATQTASTAVSPADLLRESDEQAPPRTASQNGLLGVLTNEVLDERVRTIPNSVEPMLVEHYRQLRTKILRQHEKKPFRSLLVTSSEPKEGKTLTVLNLGLIFSMLPSYRVLVVDGDLRKGSLSHSLGIQDRQGLANLLEGTSRLEEVVFRSNTIPFQFMGQGHSNLSPPDLMHSSRWPNRIREISQHFDLTLVDSPPSSLVADPQLLAAGCDAVLLVARAHRTSREAFERMRGDFQGCRVIGTVLNGGPHRASYRHYKGYYSSLSAS